MKARNFNFKKFAVLSILALLLMGMVHPTQAQRRRRKVDPNAEPAWYIGLQTNSLPAPSPLTSIYDDDDFLGLTMAGLRSPGLKNKMQVKREVQIDSTGQYISFTEKVNDQIYGIPHYMTLQQYIEKRRSDYMRQAYSDYALNRLGQGYGSSSGGAIRIDIPVEIKSKAFQKVFGGSRVGLDVTGDINIKGGLRNEKRSQVKTSYTDGQNTNFKMEQTQRFNVSGHVGEKVTIKVDQDSEAAFDFDNNIRLDYKGYEDEIIQTIEAGNISMSLPGTRFVTASSKSAGLFGIKTTAKIGNLSLTAIASQEKGEKKKIKLTGGSTDEQKELKISNYKRGVYFFLDEYYRDQYEYRDGNGNFIVDRGRKIVDIDVYKSGPNYEQLYDDSIPGTAVGYDRSTIDINGPHVELDESNGSDSDVAHIGYFVLLTPQTDYLLYEDTGFIRMTQTLQEGEVLAVAYKDADGRVRGNLTFTAEQVQAGERINLKMLRTKSPRPSNITWPLEFKNVYSIGNRNMKPEGFELTIFYDVPSGDDRETVTDADGKKITWLQAFGLDKVDQTGAQNPDAIVDNHPNIINYAFGELMLPQLRPFDPNPEANEDNEALYNLLSTAEEKPLLAPALYDTTSIATSVINEQSKFYFKLKSTAKSDVYRLGTMIIENSEEVYLNGRLLTPQVDYTLDYFSGQLTILNEEALGENANLEVSYESQQLFTIDKKTMLGIRTEYDLWGDSFIGGTFMYLNESTLDQKVRVGKGPMRNMIWDVNTSLAAKPFFLTRAANFLPFVDTRQPSSVKFEGEIAQILPNPNTRNNERTGDNDGVAYIDDFEASKRTTPLSTMRNAWSYCSPPVHAPGIDFSSGYPDLSTRGRLVYQNPFSQYPINLIWPNRDIVGQTSKTVNIMIMDFFTEGVTNPEDAWNGIQMPLSAGMSNQSEAKYLEIWVKTGTLNVSNGDWSANSGYKSTRAKLHIDLGQISEDIIPNRKLNTEDQARNGIRNNLLDEGEDIGLDGMAGVDPADFWDLNSNGIQDPGEPTSWDDWEYDYQKAHPAVFSSYEKINGTENSENDGTRIPDTEDLNGNGDVDYFNDYFEYTISLNPDDPEFQKYLAGNSLDLESGYDAGWRLFRIPLNDFARKVGSPDLSLVESARLWLTGAQEDWLKLSITELNLVGSDWKEQGIATLEYPEDFTYTYSDTMTNETIIDETVTLSVVNTHDNPEYQPPKGVEGEIDKITQVQAKEQALVLNMNNLLPKYFGQVQKIFYDSQDYIHYKNMKMYVYGLDDYASHITSDTSFVEYFFRFGADKYNYYEVKIPVFRGWTKNSIDIDLIELAQIKATVAEFDSLGSKFQILDKPGGRKWIVRGEPSLTNVKMLEAGVINNHPTEPFTGKIYMNELRLSNVKKEKGIAMRARLDFSWADLITFNGEVNRRDAEFHNVSERFGTGDNEFSYNLNTRVAVDKFLPRQLSISLPVNFNYSKSDNTPKYIPGKDIEINEDLPDSTVEKYKSISESLGGSVNFGFKSKSQNFIMKYILLPFKASYSYKESESSNSTIKFQRRESQSGSMNWGISFGRNNFVRPLKWMGNSKLLTPLTEMKLYYTPQSFSTRISGNQNSNFSERRSGTISESGTFKVNRDISTNMKITDALSLDVSRAFVNDMQDVPGDSIVEYFKNFDFGALTDINNNWSTKFSPSKLPLGLKFNASYQNAFRYSWNKQQTTQSKSTSQNNTISMNGGITPSTFAKSIFGTGSTRRRSSNKSARTGQSRAAKSTQNDSKKKEKKSNFSVSKIMSTAISSIDPINLTYNTTDNQQLYGISGLPDYRFQFGLDRELPDNLYEIMDENSTSTNRNSRAQQWRKGVSTGIKLSRKVSIQFKYDETWSKNSSSTVTGQRSKTWMYLNEGKFNQPFPTWTIRLSGLEKLPFLNKYVQSISLDHGRTGKWMESFTYKEGIKEITKESFESGFSPMMRMNFRMKNGLNMSMSYNIREKEDVTNTTGSTATRTKSQDFSLSLNYTIQGNFKIPLPGLGSKRLKNKIDIASQLTWSDNLTEKRKEAGSPFEPTAKTNKLLFRPEVKYSFSSRVRGGIYFETGYTDNMSIGKTSFNEFGLDVNISIRN